MAQSDSIVIWSEDFTGYLTDDKPQQGKTASYPNTNLSKATIWVARNCGGKVPELSLPKDDSDNGYGFYVSIPLYGASGNFTLKFKSNAPSHIKVKYASKRKDVSIAPKGESRKQYSIDVPTGKKQLDLAFIANAKCNIDDILLLGPSDCRPDKPLPNISFPIDTLSVYLGEPFHPVQLENADNVDVSYWSSDKQIASVDNDGNITPHALGCTTISAIFTGNETYGYHETSYVLDVKRRVPDDEIFYEDFDGIWSSANRIDNFVGPSGLIRAGLSGKFSNRYSGDNPYASYKCIVTEGSNAYTVGPIDEFKGGDIILSFKTAKNKIGNNDAKLELLLNGKTVDTKTFQSDLHKWSTLSFPLSDLDANTVFKFSAAIETFIDSVSIISIPKNIPLKISSVGYATLYYDMYALKVPANVNAYTARVEGDKIEASHRYASGDVIPKATGVVLKAPEGNYTFDVAYDEEGIADPQNQLRGSDYRKETTGGSVYYMLANDNGEAGFFWGEDDGAAFLSGAHKAYLALPADSKAKNNSGFTFDFDDATTNIKRVQEAAIADCKTYNVLGQRVKGSSFNGIIIKGGKKYVSNKR